MENLHRPAGSVQKGQKLNITLCLPRKAAAQNVFIYIHADGCEESAHKMCWSGIDRNMDIYSYVFCPCDTGLFWYNFSADGRVIGANNDSFIVEDNFFQLTVFDKIYESPEHLSGGIMYQIMVDRFYCEEAIKTRDDVVYRDDWGGVPGYQADTEGIVPNNDFFGGNIRGIIAKLDYLKSLNVSCIYLNPIFKANSNHKYDTADYKQVDPLFGTNEDLELLCSRAGEYGMSVVLDGVFSHTGSDSVYFDILGKYGDSGAYRSKESPYYSWYKFNRYPDDYECWWGIKILPNVNELDPSYNEFINGKDGIIRYWLKKGIAGWRLDVADELPDLFIERIAKGAKAEKKDALVLGEVWEDASNKVSYSMRRKYFLGTELDSVTNYPFKTAIIDFVQKGDSKTFTQRVNSIIRNYPPHVLNCLMNVLGTHDTTRILTALSDLDAHKMTKQERSEAFLIRHEKSIAFERLKCAVVLQYTLPGFPCVFYGDEAGMEGHEDPFNRRCYPWGSEDKSILEFYSALGKFRASRTEFKKGFLEFLSAPEGVVCYTREDGNGETSVVIVNMSEDEFELKTEGEWFDAFTGEKLTVLKAPKKSALLAHN